jgi:hypothetical protein
MGGGGGGGRGLTPDELKSLQQKAKKSLKDGDGTGKCNVFISFSSEDLGEVNLLRGQAKNENSDIEFNDWSLKEPFDSKKADYIGDSAPTRLPKAVTENKVPIVPWNQKELAKAIKKQSENR